MKHSLTYHVTSIKDATDNLDRYQRYVNRAAWTRAWKMRDAVNAYGATEVAKALGMSRARVYAIIARCKKLTEA